MKLNRLVQYITALNCAKNRTKWWRYFVDCNLSFQMKCFVVATFLRTSASCSRPTSVIAELLVLWDRRILAGLLWFWLPVVTGRVSLVWLVIVDRGVTSMSWHTTLTQSVALQTTERATDGSTQLSECVSVCSRMHRWLTDIIIMWAAAAAAAAAVRLACRLQCSSSVHHASSRCLTSSYWSVTTRRPVRAAPNRASLHSATTAVPCRAVVPLHSSP